MKSKRFLIVAVIFLVILVLAGWAGRYFFLQNKITFLLNQRRYDQAVSLLKDVQAHDPSSRRTKFLQTKTLTITGDYAQAIDNGSVGNLRKAYPESDYWRAIAEYQLGHDSSARRFALNYLKSAASLSSSSDKIAKALAGQKVLLGQTEDNAPSYKLLFPVEKAVYTGFAAEESMELGKLVPAARLYRRAFLLGNRNRKLLSDAARVCALVGYAQDALMFFDYSGSKSIDHLFRHFEKSYRNYRIVSLTLHNDDLAQGGRKIDIARALAWVANVYLREDVEGHKDQVERIMNDLMLEYPYDVVLQVRKAAMLETLGRGEEAKNIYRQLQQKFPNYTVLIRMAALDNVAESEITSRSNGFLKDLDSVVSAPLSGLDIQNGVVGDHAVEVQSGGEIKTRLPANERGNYLLMIVARGSQIKGKWPLVRVYVDDEPVGVMYISRDNWDCYSLALPLKEGMHSIKLKYENNSDEGTEPVVGNRNLYLRSLFMAVTGVADVD